MTETQPGHPHHFSLWAILECPACQGILRAHRARLAALIERRTDEEGDPSPAEPPVDRPGIRRPTVRAAVLAFALALLGSLGGAARTEADLFTTPGNPDTPPASGQPPAGQPAAPVRLGATGPLTGHRAHVGTILTTARALLVLESQATLLIEDDTSVPVRTIPAARSLENAGRIQAFLSPLELYPVGSVSPYLAHTKTPTLFVSTPVSGWATGSRVIGFPPSAQGTAQVLAESVGRALTRRLNERRHEPPFQGAWVFWADTEDGRERLAGVRRAALPGVSEVPFGADGTADLPGRTAPDALLVIGSPAQAAMVAARVRALPVACAVAGPGPLPPRPGARDSEQGCAEPPVVALGLAEPFDWAELRHAALTGAWITEWLALDSAAFAWHEQALRRALPGQIPSRFTVWGHALAEVTGEVLRRAGHGADGPALLRAAESLRAWQGRLLPPVTLDRRDHWPVEHVRLVEIVAGRGLRPLPGWIEVPRP